MKHPEGPPEMVIGHVALQRGDVERVKDDDAADRKGHRTKGHD